MNPTQIGFRHKRSTISPSFCEDIISKLEKRDDVDAIYLDFPKVFDKLDRNVKLKHFTSQEKSLNVWKPSLKRGNKELK